MFLRVLKVVTVTLAGGAFLLTGAPLIAEKWATRPPAFPTRDVNPLTELGLPFEEVVFPAEDGRLLRGWFIPAPASSRDAPAILYAHGSGRDQRSGLSLVPPLHRAGYHVLLFSYRGFGQSEGDGRGLTYGVGESQDVDSAVHFLREERGVRNVGAIGYSVGAVSVILSAARNQDIGAVVAVAPFASVAEVWTANRPPLLPPFVLDWTLRLVEWHKGFSRAEACAVDVVGRIAPRPLLLIYGTNDGHIPLGHAQQMLTAAGQPSTLWLVEGETHDSIRTHALEALLPEVINIFGAALGYADNSLYPRGEINARQAMRLREHETYTQIRIR
ncbi:MAG: alpha/beta fold hydrolase [Anaerolineae bacterium]|jgi:pimeloyl-ACP methyl ester carboxylesterase|nr:alpha/beta fold hydrolase [Anaerolineae bacterium]MDH7472785.1 alpha/beta fold hydrolase [Anaerolineae bacterium]